MEYNNNLEGRTLGKFLQSSPYNSSPAMMKLKQTIKEQHLDVRSLKCNLGEVL